MPSVATLILAGLVVVLVLLGMALSWVRHNRLVTRLDEILARLDKAPGKSGDRAVELLEAKNFHDDLLAELESLLTEAYRVKDKERVQQLQRMRERLETFRARTLDKAVRSLDEAAKADASGGAAKGRKSR